MPHKYIWRIILIYKIKRSIIAKWLTAFRIDSSLKKLLRAWILGFEVCCDGQDSPYQGDQDWELPPSCLSQVHARASKLRWDVGRRENVLHKPTSFLLTTYLMSPFLVEKFYYVTINRLSGKMTVFAHGYIYLLSKPKITKRADIHRGVSPNFWKVLAGQK